MKETKQDKALKYLSENPSLSYEEVANLVNCHLNTVKIAAKNLREKDQPKGQESDQSLYQGTKECFENVDPIKLLQDKLIQKCSKANPETRALDSLMRLLEKTGKLDIKIQDEEECKQQLSKMSEEELVLTSIDKRLQKNISPNKDLKENFYS